jgi:hypothetical protein
MLVYIGGEALLSSLDGENGRPIPMVPRIDDVEAITNYG